MRPFGSYDKLDNLTNSVDRGGRTTKQTYDLTGKLTATTRVMADNSEITDQYVYDNQFNGLNIIDGLNRAVETYSLDDKDRVTSVVNLEGQTMSVRYGAADFVRGITRFDGSVVSNIYNSEALVQETHYPDDTLAFTYYSNGVMKTASNSLGQITNVYNGCDWLVSTWGVTPNSTVSYGYFPAGNISNITSAAGTCLYGYDAGERLTSLTHNGQLYVSSYGSNGLVAQVQNTNSGLRVTNSFDVMDRLTSRAWYGSTGNVLRSFAYQYNNADMITNETLADGTVLGYSYDYLDRLTGEKRTLGGTTEYDVAYSYDNVGNRLTKTRSGITVTYGYSNNCNQLLTWNATSINSFADLSKVDVSGKMSDLSGAIVTNPALGQKYISNSVSSVAAVVSTASGTNFSSSAFILTNGPQSIIAAIADTAGNTGYATNTVTLQIPTNGTYALDPAGCVTQMVTIGTGNYSSRMVLAWDGRYELTSISTNGAMAETATYDVLGRRVSIGANGETNYLVYAGNQVVAEVGATGDVRRAYTYGPGIDNLFAMATYTGGVTHVYYYLTDHLGTVHAVANEAGTIVESYKYDAWGRVLEVRDGSGNLSVEADGRWRSTIGNRYLFQGREYSWATGLYNFRARWYEPITGRWLSNDPIGISGGLDQYLFCSDNPANTRDPAGLCGSGFSCKEICDELRSVEEGQKVNLEMLRTGESLKDANGRVRGTATMGGDTRLLTQFENKPSNVVGGLAGSIFFHTVGWVVGQVMNSTGMTDSPMNFNSMQGAAELLRSQTYIDQLKAMAKAKGCQCDGN